MAVSKTTEIGRVVQADEAKPGYTDAELIKGFVEGSDEAFNRLVLKHQRRAFNIAYRFLGNYEDAAEVAQDAFVRVYRGLRSFKGKASFQTWLYKIVLNTARNKYRRKKRRGDFKKLSLDNPKKYGDGEESREVLDVKLSPEREIAGKEITEKIQDGLSALPEDHRQVIILRHIEGLSYGQMSEILKCAEGTIKSRLHRARMELRELLKELL